MNIELKLQMNTQQRLVMTPMLQQAIKLLIMTRLELVQAIRTEVQDIEFISQSPSRISVSVKLKYSEKIINANGELISETSFKPFLKVKYILGFSNKSWKLVDYVSGV